MDFKDIADRIIYQLKLLNIHAYIWSAATTGSVYIRFKDHRIGSIRIGDHKGRSQYKYKYNIRKDIPKSHNRWAKDRGIWRCYLHTSDYLSIIPEIELRANQVNKWKNYKYRYGIPKHLRKKTVKT